MRFLPGLALVAGLATLLPLPRATTAAPAPLLSARDRRIAVRASHLAVHGPAPAIRYLDTQRPVAGVQLGADRETIDLHFRDGNELVIFPPSGHAGPMPAIPHPATLHRLLQTTTPGTARAAVLEPFDDQLGGASAGQQEANDLTKAGFNVDVFRGQQVNVPVLLSMNQYSVIFMETHSGLLPNGDAIVDTHETDSDLTQYPALREQRAGGDGSLVQGLAAGESGIFIAFTSTLVSKHLGSFPADSIVFLNGCNLDAATTFWGAFHDKGVAASLSWDNDVFLPSAVAAGDFVMDQLAAGHTVAESLDAAQAAGLATSLSEQGNTHLLYRYDGTDTLARALAGVNATATPTPTTTAAVTATATSTPTPTPTTVPVTLSFTQLRALSSSNKSERQFGVGSVAHLNGTFTLANAPEAVSVRVKAAYHYQWAKGSPHRFAGAHAASTHRVMTARDGANHVTLAYKIPKPAHGSRYSGVKITVTLSADGQVRKRSVTIRVR